MDAQDRSKIGYYKKITTYVARPTFSTVLKRYCFSTEFIKEALGHTDLKITENYLDRFEKEVKKEYAGRLVDFKNNQFIDVQQPQIPPAN